MTSFDPENVVGISETSIAPPLAAAYLWLAAEEGNPSESDEVLQGFLINAYPDGVPPGYVSKFREIVESVESDPGENERTGSFDKARMVEQARFEILSLLRRFALLEMGIDPTMKTEKFRDNERFGLTLGMLDEVDIPGFSAVPITECPQCTLLGDIPAWFGWRSTKAGRKPQSWCRICRSLQGDKLEYEDLATEELWVMQADDWFELAHWGKETSILNGWERKFSYSIGKRLSNGKELTEKQVSSAVRILTKAIKGGFETS